MSDKVGYTVVVRYPDYLRAGDAIMDYHIGHVYVLPADPSREAIMAAETAQGMLANVELVDDQDDFEVIAIFKGFHEPIYVASQ